MAERAQYWPGLGLERDEAHNSFGLTAARQTWGLAEGRVGNPPGVPAANYQTYVLLANPGTKAANVTIRFLRETGAPVVRSFVGATREPAERGGGRRRQHCAGAVERALRRVHRRHQPIVVERALYGDAGTQVFGIGTNATGTPLP